MAVKYLAHLLMENKQREMIFLLQCHLIFCILLNKKIHDLEVR